MPNWCMNSGRLYLPDNASDEARDAFRKLKEDKAEKGWFANIAPTPDEMNLGLASAQGTQEFMSLDWLKANSKFTGDFGTFETLTFDEGGSHTEFKASDEYTAYLTETYGATNWYSWNLENYGTKWDVKVEISEWGDEEVHFSFDSAWGAPVEFFEKFVKPLRIGYELRYYEPGCCFAGYATFTPHESDPELDEYDGETYENDDYIIYLLDEDMESIDALISEVGDYDNYDDFAANNSYGEEVMKRVRDHYTPPSAPAKRVARVVEVGEIISVAVPAKAAKKKAPAKKVATKKAAVKKAPAKKAAAKRSAKSN